VSESSYPISRRRQEICFAESHAAAGKHTCNHNEKAMGDDKKGISSSQLCGRQKTKEERPTAVPLSSKVAAGRPHSALQYSRR